MIEKRPDPSSYATAFEWKGKDVSPKKTSWNDMVWKGQSQSVYHWSSINNFDIFENQAKAYILTLCKSSGHGFWNYSWIILNLDSKNNRFHYLSVLTIVLSVLSIIFLSEDIFYLTITKPFGLRFFFALFRKLIVSLSRRWVRAHCIQIQLYWN